MAKLPRNYRISSEVDQLLKFEAARLTEEQERKVSEADVIELAVVKWCTGADANCDNCNTVERRAVAEAAMRHAESSSDQTLSVKPTPRRAETVAQRKERETTEHAQKLAESDVLAQMTGRDDIEYDLENVPHRSVLNIAAANTRADRKHYEAVQREAKPLNRPHGGTEAKRRREQ